jgi:hypothetical protein
LCGIPQQRIFPGESWPVLELDGEGKIRIEGFSIAFREKKPPKPYLICPFFRRRLRLPEGNLKSQLIYNNINKYGQVPPLNFLTDGGRSFS